MQRHNLHSSPPWRSFCSCKRKQNRAKGNQAFPFANPFDAKLRLDTDDALASSVRHRRYALKVPAAHFMWGNCKPIAESHAAETVGKTSSYLPRRPLPRIGGGVGGAEPSAASGGCSEAEHPQRSKKSSKRAARRFFRAPQGGGGRCAMDTFGAHLCAVRIWIFRPRKI